MWAESNFWFRCYRTLTTMTAFGSLWLSNQPGMSSMGKLMALALLCTLGAAVLFQPALMGPPRTRPAEGSWSRYQRRMIPAIKPRQGSAGRWTRREGRCRHVP